MQTFSRNVFTQKEKKNIDIWVIVKGFSDPLHIKLGSMWHANQQINLCSTLTLTCITSHSSYLSTTHNFPAFKCCVKHIKLLHSFSREIRWIMIQQKLFWRGWMSVCEECLDTKAWRKACSTKWVGFHTYKQSQYPKLKVWRWFVSQVLLDWRRVKSNKRAGVNWGEGHTKGLQTGHKGILCAPQNKQTFSWHTVWGLVFFPFLFQIRKLGLYCNSVSTSLHVETIQRMFDQSPLETACLLPKKQKKTLAYFLNMLNQQTRKLMTKQKSCFDFSWGTDRLLRKRVTVCGKVHLHKKTLGL